MCLLLFFSFMCAPQFHPLRLFLRPYKHACSHFKAETTISFYKLSELTENRRKFFIVSSEERQKCDRNLNVVVGFIRSAK